LLLKYHIKILQRIWLQYVCSTAIVGMLLECIAVPGANPTTYEFKATTPAL
jgi:hypothetical protein